MTRYALLSLLLIPFSSRILLVASSSHHQDNDTEPKTGSWKNCTESYKPLSKAKEELQSSEIVHPDSDIITISCNNIHYRVPHKSLSKVKRKGHMGLERIVIGVLSGAGGKGPEKRNSIRSTWAYRKSNVFFIVAGPWEDIQFEYETFGDLLWIEKDEVYVTETSVLTFKTESFVAVMYNEFMSKEGTSISFLFKADDDSYVDVEKLYKALLDEPKHRKYELDYWGKCNKAGTGALKPKREKSNKWYISYEIYPELEYPPFCQGAGIGLSKKFLDCAIGMDHIKHIRYQPNEDVAIGLLAERCGIEPEHDDRIVIRYDDEITMHKKIVQHYVKTETEMRLHHKDVTGVMGPKIYY